MILASVKFEKEETPTVSRSFEAENGATIYLPQEALQGEDIPAFALWNKGGYSKIEVDLPEPLKLKEIYNVADKKFTIAKGVVTIENVEVDGYLGMLLESSRAPSTKQIVKVQFMLHRVNGQIDTKDAKIELYRPLLGIPVKSLEITLDPEKGQSKPLVPIRKEGEGTVMVWFEALPESQVRIEEAKDMRLLREALKQELDPGFTKLIQKYSDYTNMLSEVHELLTGPPNFSEEEWTKDIRRTLLSLREIGLSDKKFATEFVEMIGEAFLKNLHLFNPFQQMTDYLQSIASKNILLQNPLDAALFEQGTQLLRLRVSYTDLTFNYFPPIIVEVSVVGVKTGEIPLYRLFDWV